MLRSPVGPVYRLVFAANIAQALPQFVSTQVDINTIGVVQFWLHSQEQIYRVKGGGRISKG